MKSLVHIIDDDESMRRLLKDLMESVQLEVKSYISAEEFISDYDSSSPGCILSDVRMPRMSGVELQQKLKEMEINIPIILLTGYGDVQMAVNAMQEEAFDFIEKPFNNQHLIDRVQKALALSEQTHSKQKGKAEHFRKYQNLTPREKDVFKLIVCGETNKAVAHHLDISNKTVEVHRSRIMTKFRASGLADLIKVNDTIQS